MLYYLFNYLQECDFPGAGVFNYVTFRAAIAVILSLVVAVWFGNWFIKMLKRKKITETQRDASIDPYNTKKVGVPTMGGVIIIAAILIPVLLVCKLHSVYTLLMIATTLILGQTPERRLEARSEVGWSDSLGSACWPDPAFQPCSTDQRNRSSED